MTAGTTVALLGHLERLLVTHKNLLFRCETHQKISRAATALAGTYKEGAMS